MGKKKKQKVEQLSSEPFFEENLQEENDATLFQKHLDATDWEKVSQVIKKRGEFTPNPKKTKKERAKKITLDLHGYTLKEAKELVDQEIEKAIDSKIDESTFSIITGRGLRSGPEGSILAREIPLHIKKKWAKRIVFMEESPADLIIQGKPLRGSFSVIFKTNS